MQFDFTNLNLDTILAQALAYLTYVGILAGALQVFINQLKPVFIEPLKAKMDEAQYLATIYIIRTLFATVAYFTLWGGVPATRSVLPEFATALPDFGIAFFTIMIAVAGTEVIHAWISNAYQFKEMAKSLKIDTVIAQPSLTLDGTVESSKTVTVTQVDSNGEPATAVASIAAPTPIILG